MISATWADDGGWVDGVDGVDEEEEEELGRQTGARPLGGKD